VVGVVADAVYQSIRETPKPTMYLPLAQADGYRRGLYASVSVGVRAEAGETGALSKPIAAAIGTVDPAVSLTFRTMSDQVNGTIAQERVVAVLAGFFGVLALGLATLGLYGVTMYAVTRRMRELGIRIALGAGRSRIVGSILGKALLLVACGLVIGTVASWYLTRLIGSLLYGLAPHDPASIAWALGILLTASGIAAWIPARRAARVDPVSLLRSE
jgi:ABC-type antimicrobial peptide transport system permease subunit